jgi:hypothetical protein
VNIPFLYESGEQFLVDVDAAYKEYEEAQKAYNEVFNNYFKTRLAAEKTKKVKDEDWNSFFGYNEQLKKTNQAMTEINERFLKILPFHVSDYPESEYRSELRIYELEEWFNIVAQKRDGV